MDSVFLLWHTHETKDETDEKLIGAYQTRDDAEAAITRVIDKPGFRDAPDGFEITEYIIGKDEWTEGYISVGEAQTE